MKEQWEEAVKGVGFTDKPKTKADAIQTLVAHVMARRAGVDRADV